MLTMPSDKHVLGVQEGWWELQGGKELSWRGVVAILEGFSKELSQVLKIESAIRLSDQDKAL